ncbi:MAG: SemiSWEET family transporter [archaeon]
MEFVGILGAFMLIAAWLPPTIKAVIKKKSDMNLWFELLFFLGAFLLTVYALQTGDLVFVALNAAAAIFAFINLGYIPHKMRTIEHEIEEITGIKGKKYYHVKKKRRFK